MRPMKERLSFPPVEENTVEDDEMDSDFMDLEQDFDVVCNVVSILPSEYDMMSKVEESKEDYNPEDMEKYKFIHLKPLFIQAKVDGIGVNKVLVDGVVAVNVMPHSYLRRLENMTNFVHGSSIKSQLQFAPMERMDTCDWCCSFIYAPKSYNPEGYGSVKNVEADQSYFLAEVNNFTRKTFEKSLAKIAPCSFVEDGDNDQIDASSVRLDPTHGFMLEKEVLNT
ncbi:hypothetical protein MTR_4g044357 [Medicago truncatula]|uniref:Uncharacterized protein n=1 Tax=Medicago truncatula TaxID=3880 RepID=A0A072UIN1_MEDTR|nr:hypothetical protein MTR_4g044357 [Medicago truncatula]